MSMSQNGGSERPARVCQFPACGRRHRAVRTYEIVYEDGRIVIDLCAAHGSPLKDLRLRVIRGGAASLLPRRPVVSRNTTEAIDEGLLPDEL
jgi:hypothetical protein